jgi:hypothetical protein
MTWVHFLIVAFFAFMLINGLKKGNEAQSDLYNMEGCVRAAQTLEYARNCTFDK